MKKKSKDPDDPAVKKQLIELWKDSPLNDEPFTKEQNEYFDRMLEERRKAKAAAAQERGCPPWREQ